MLKDQRLRLTYKWGQFNYHLKYSGRSASQWGGSLCNLTRRTLLAGSLRRAYERRVKQHAPYLPAISADARSILDTIETEGGFTAPVESLGVPGTVELLQSAKSLLPVLMKSQPSRPGGSTVQLDEAHFRELPEIFLWGLNDSLLDLVETYLGVPAGYQGVNVTRSIADNKQNGTRMWHLDPQDHRLFRIIIYLDAVDRHSGPFQYIPRQQSDSARKLLGYANENVPENIMREATRGDHWKTCTGPRGTAVLTDPANVFHRGKMPESRERFAIFYSYHSSEPLHEQYLPPGFSPDLLAHMDDKLTDRQRACVFWRR